MVSCVADGKTKAYEALPDGEFHFVGWSRIPLVSCAPGVAEVDEDSVSADTGLPGIVLG